MLGGLSTKSGIENADAFAPDPLLCPFLFSMPRPECRDDQPQDTCSIDDVSLIPETERYYITCYLIESILITPLVSPYRVAFCSFA